MFVLKPDLDASFIALELVITRYPILLGVGHRLSDEVAFWKWDKQSHVRAARPARLGEQNVGAARTATDREILAADLPILQRLFYFGGNQIDFCAGKSWLLAIDFVGHVSAADEYALVCGLKLNWRV